MSNLHTDVHVNTVVSEQESAALTFRKNERLCSKKQIEMLFEGGSSRSMTAFPLRAVFRFMPSEAVLAEQVQADITADEAEKVPNEAEKSIHEVGNAATKLLISVPKKYFKRAVKRNRVKRQVREAYRKNKGLLREVRKKHADETLLLALIWLDDVLHDSSNVEKQVCNLLKRIGELP